MIEDRKHSSKLVAGLTLQAFSVGDAARSRLGSRAKGQVHSTYEGALNITFRKGIVSVVARSKGRGPLNLVLSSDTVNFTQGAGEGSKVHFNGDLLTIGDRIRIVLQGAELYSSPVRFGRRPLGYNLIRRNIEDAQEVILATGRLEGLGYLLDPSKAEQGSGATSNPFISMAHRAVLSFTKMYSEGDATGAVEAAKELIGLGIGLTPSGDDVLSGMLMALVLGWKNGITRSPVIREVADGVAGAAVGRTTLLSQNYIQQASLGKANEAVAQFVDDIFTGTHEDVMRSLAELIGFGATSGTDIAVGVTLGAATALGEQVGGA